MCRLCVFKCDFTNFDEESACKLFVIVLLVVIVNIIHCVRTVKDCSVRVTIMNSLKPLRNSKIACCVVGCHNTYYNTDASIKFYNFPGRWYKKERREIWINRVRRVDANNKTAWKPKIHDRVCSTHFVGNLKSNNPLHPAYNPTLFPKEYLSKKQGDTLKVDRFDRVVHRSMNQNSQINIEPLPQSSLNNCSALSESFTKLTNNDFSCQVNFENVLEKNIFLFESTFYAGENGHEVSTQVDLPEVSINNNLWKRSEEKCVGNDDTIECNGFHGYKSIKTDNELITMAGVTFDRFCLLLSFLTFVHGNSKLNAEDKLLLFLMKMKQGASHAFLAVLFQIHISTCSRIFISVLDELVQKMRNFVFWPDRSVIDNTMPTSFKVNYPKCRVIIDCTEFKIQQPPKVDERIYTYSHYKGTFTAKVLIGISPTGFVSFVSPCYGGRSSDTFITNDCGILELLEPNDVVLADTGFPGIKCKDDIILVLPPFVHDGHLSYEEVEETYSIASVRIHVERSIQRIKIYNILQNISYNLFTHLDDIVHMCCVLTNLQPPTMKLEEE